ncbi:hypothetical protein [Streptomyces sp. RerS4]|uniref:hypothetical protein n=1 Tax=Streptomyces sp. RerS4 TaxID=2942449 RepID=UPI00201C9D94|nr:hypothetical protein [Streptomyces sp. RerS4]UQX04644.1 hypothetical protein M4D82_32130 [Streptomyces sp. RerS4]
MDAAAAFAVRAATAARHSGRPVLLAAAVRAAEPPLRRTGRADTALRLIGESARGAGIGLWPTAAVLDASGMVALTAAYTAAQARIPSPPSSSRPWQNSPRPASSVNAGRVPAGGELLQATPQEACRPSVRALLDTVG